jgi:hypothetical protein
MNGVMINLAPRNPLAPCLPAVAPCYNKAEVHPAFYQGILNRAGLDFAWMTLPAMRMERWIIDNQNWRAPRVRHRRFP